MCFKHKKNTIGLILVWFSTTRTACKTPRTSKITLSGLLIRAFCRKDLNVCIQISRKRKTKSRNSFKHCKWHPKENLGLKYEQTLTKLRKWKFFANEKWSEEVVETSSVKNFFSVNCATKTAQKCLNRKILIWTDDCENMIRLDSFIYNLRRKRQKRPS